MNRNDLKRLQFELWETQCILYWILGFLLIHAPSRDEHILGWLVVGYATLCAMATISKLVMLRILEQQEKV